MGYGSVAPVTGEYISGALPKGGRRILAIDIARSGLGPLDGPAGAGGLLTIKAGRAANLAMVVDRPGSAFKALDACVVDLVKTWGMDEATQAAIAVPPAALAPTYRYFSDGDYPEASVRDNEQGSSGVRFLVAVDGTARDCTVLEPSGSARLDATTCRLLGERARFKPALGHDGKPLASLSFMRVRWVLPN